MDLEKARLKHEKKKLGKCFDCAYRKNDSCLTGIYCIVREERMINDILGDLFKIKFCKYYEKENKRG